MDNGSLVIVVKQQKSKIITNDFFLLNFKTEVVIIIEFSKGKQSNFIFMSNL